MPRRNADDPSFPARCDRDVAIVHGDALAELRKLCDSSIDAIVADPPYGISFMGRKWDYDVPSVDVWRECLRVMKPGAHALVACGTRTQHRMACNLEDAGFEIRDVVAWLYGSGFPKSLDISKAIDKRGGSAILAAELRAAIKLARTSRGISVTEADRKYCGGSTLWSWFEGRPAGQHIPTQHMMEAIAADWPELTHYATALAEIEREVVGSLAGTELVVAPGQGTIRDRVTLDLTAPSTSAAQQWQGWGTALKPAMELFTLVRKPLSEPTVAANVLRWGTGALNIDACRIESDGSHKRPPQNANNGDVFNLSKPFAPTNAEGRWPANVTHDGSQQVLNLMPVTKARGNIGGSKGGGGMYGHSECVNNFGASDSGSAARFFYCAKASKSERNHGLDTTIKNNHPTVKPVKLMLWLCNLITPPGGTVLDPFMGSGTTGIACAQAGFQFIGIERELPYVEIAEARIAAANA